MRKEEEEEEELGNSKAKANLEAGGIAVVFGFTVLTALLCLPTDAKHVSDTCFTVVSLLLAFATSVSGSCLVFLSMAMIGLPRRLVSGVQRGAPQCLVVLCTTLSAMTLVSLLAFLPVIVLCVVGLAVFALSVAAAYWYGCTSRVALAGGDAAVATCREYKEEMEAAWKTASTVTNSASGGLVGVLPGAWNIAGATTRPVTATYVSIFFMFSTAIIGMSAMTVSKRAVVDVATNRRFLVGAIRVTNAFLLCMLACAALAVSYVVLGFLMLAAFAPLAVTSLVFLLLRHCIRRRAGGRSGLLDDQPEPEARLKAMEDIASNVTAATLGGIMSILGWSLGQEDHRKAGPLDAVMVILTSAFVSGFGFMLLAAVPARARLALAVKVLTGSCMVLIAATAVAVYGTEAWRI